MNHEATLADLIRFILGPGAYAMTTEELVRAAKTRVADDRYRLADIRREHFERDPIRKRVGMLRATAARERG
jgi:hypothetical protein